MIWLEIQDMTFTVVTQKLHDCLLWDPQLNAVVKMLTSTIRFNIAVVFSGINTICMIKDETGTKGGMYERLD